MKIKWNVYESSCFDNNNIEAFLRLFKYLTREHLFLKKPILLLNTRLVLSCCIVSSQGY